MNHKVSKDKIDCTVVEAKGLKGQDDAEFDIHYTYSVKFVVSVPLQFFLPYFSLGGLIM